MDMVAADLTLTQERSEVLDFASPYLTHSLSVLMKKLPDVGQRGAVGILAAFDILVKSRTHRCPSCEEAPAWILQFIHSFIHSFTDLSSFPAKCGYFRS